jgi:hypothetical protein
VASVSTASSNTSTRWVNILRSSANNSYNSAVLSESGNI